MAVKSTAYDTWVLLPLVTLAIIYNLAAFIPNSWLPPEWWGHVGYASDLFLMLGQRTTVTTHALRDALQPGGTLERLGTVWSTQFGEAGIDRLLWRLSSVDGRVRRNLIQKLYLVLGAWPILACTFCSHKADCGKYAILLLLQPYIAHAILIALLTIPPSGALPRIVQWAVDASAQDASIVPQYSREASRMPIILALFGAFLAEVLIIFRAEDLGAVYGRWEHVREEFTQWHANIHLARHALFLTLVIIVYARKQKRLPAVAVIEALRGLTVTSAHVDALVEYKGRQTPMKQEM